MKINTNDYFIFDESVFISPTSVIVGDITFGKNCTVWFNAVIRGDLSPIKIGENSNIQDCCVIHTESTHPVTIGNNVTIGHGAIIHGATLEDNTLIGMGAIILNGAKIGTNSIIGAGALVTEGTEIPPNSVAVGSPAKVIKSINDKGTEMIKLSAKHYVEAGKAYIKKFEQEDNEGIWA